MLLNFYPFGWPDVSAAQSYAAAERHSCHSLSLSDVWAGGGSRDALILFHQNRYCDEAYQYG